MKAALQAEREKVRAQAADAQGALAVLGAFRLRAGLTVDQGSTGP